MEWILGCKMVQKLTMLYYIKKEGVNVRFFHLTTFTKMTMKYSFLYSFFYNNSKVNINNIIFSENGFLH